MLVMISMHTVKLICHFINSLTLGLLILIHLTTSASLNCFLSALTGESGTAVTITEKSLEGLELKRFKKGWQENAFNQYVSDIVSVHRSLPDFRDKE